VASANRLPSVKHEVEGCPSCPLRATVLVDVDELDLEQGGVAHKCQHPSVQGRDVTGEEGVPDFCPAGARPLLLVVDPEVASG
jgi:hypothetical protein